MRSPIARGFFALGRLTEWAHRRIHGPQFAPGDVVECADGVTRTLGYRGKHLWVARDGAGLSEDGIIRVVRYGEGE